MINFHVSNEELYHQEETFMEVMSQNGVGQVHSTSELKMQQVQRVVMGNYNNNQNGCIKTSFKKKEIMKK